MSSRLSALSFTFLYKHKYNFCLVSSLGLRHYCSPIPKIKESVISSHVKPTQVIKPIQAVISQSGDEILSSVDSDSISVGETISILKALRMNIIFKNTNSNAFKNDKKFKILCNYFEKNSFAMRPNMLISGLRSLLEIGVPPDASCVVSAEQNILNKVHIFSIFNIIGCLYFHHKYMKTDLQKELVNELISNLCKRFSEINTKGEVLLLVNFLHIFNREELKVFQPKIMEIIFKLTGPEMFKMLSTLSENSCRNVSVLNALSLNMRDKIKDLNMKEKLGILYAFKNLNFMDENLISGLMDEIMKEIPKVKQPSVISNLLTTCGQLRWKEQNVFKACGKWIIDNIDVCRQKECVAYILTAAILNFNDFYVMDTMKAILPSISPDKIESPNIWLDVVWSLAALNFSTKDTLLHVLSPHFYKKLIDGSDFQQVTNKLKLMNLRAVLKMHYPECIFGLQFYLDPIKMYHTEESIQKRRHVIKVLSNFIPKEKFLYVDQNTDLGVYIDAEFIMNKFMKPQPISEYGILSKPTSKSLPNDCQRIALLIYFHKDYTLNVKSPTGYMSLSTRILRAHGYTVVRVSFSQFIENDTEVKKAKYLMEKITNTMKRENNL